MKIYEEKRLFDFTFWGGAEFLALILTEEEFDIIEQNLNEVYGKEHSFEDTFINDLFWFDTNFIAECLGYNNFEEMMENRR